MTDSNKVDLAVGVLNVLAGLPRGVDVAGKFEPLYKEVIEALEKYPEPKQEPVANKSKSTKPDA